MSTSPDTVTDILRLANRAHDTAGQAGRAEQQEVLAEQAGRWSEDVVTLVVAGAQKRGKSRLLNALLRHPDLLPVDADVATHTRVTIEHGDTLSAVVERRSSDGEVSTAPIDPAALADYASVLGDPARRAGVTGVALRVPEPALDGVRLVDTPGVDSLTLGHRHATVAALHRADGLLFAVSAQDQPILRHELEFLAEAAQKVHSIAFMLTKVEDSPAWRELLTENRERLASFVSRAVTDGAMDPDLGQRLRQAPWIPVSAKLAEAAVALEQAGRTERAADRLERSGLPVLRNHLRRCSERRRLVRAAGVLTLTESVLRTLAETVRDEAAAGSADEDAVPARKAEIDAGLEQLRTLRRERRARSIDHQFLGQEVGRRVRVTLEGYRRGYDREIAEHSSPKELTAYAAQLPESLERSLTAAWEEVAGDTRELAENTLSTYLSGLGIPAVDLDPDMLVRRDGAVPGLHTDGPAGKPLDVIADGLPSVMMASSLTFASANLLGLSAGLAIAGPAVIGVAVAGVFLLHKKRLAEAARTRTALTKGVGDVFLTAAGEMTISAQQAVAAWRAVVEQSIDDALEDQRADLEKRKAAVAEMAKRDAAQRRSVAEQARARAEAVREMVERATALRAALAEELRTDPRATAPAVATT